MCAVARFLCGGGAALELTAHAQRTALGVVDLGVSEVRCTGWSFFLSARGRGVTCQLPPPTPSRLLHEKQAHARWL